jgi:hypothetical protein
MRAKTGKVVRRVSAKVGQGLAQRSGISASTRAGVGAGAGTVAKPMVGAGAGIGTGVGAQAGEEFICTEV